MPGLRAGLYYYDSANELRLPEVTGAHERAANGDAHALLLALLEASGLSHSETQSITLGDRDRLLASVYVQLYGDQISANARCFECSEAYELGFSLTELSNSCSPQKGLANHLMQVPCDDTVLRLPVVHDLSGNPSGLLERLVVSGPSPNIETASTLLQQADPALELNLDGECPSCMAAQAVPFSLSAFFGAALSRDNTFLWREVHLLARTYHWSLESLLALSRSERHALVRLHLDDQQARSRIRSIA